MHEVSIANNLIRIIQQEMLKHNAARLISVSICYGSIANIVPDSLQFAFDLLIAETPLAGAAMEMREEPLLLSCGYCKNTFSPLAVSLLEVFSCPHCGETSGHTVIAGKELYIDTIEVE